MDSRQKVARLAGFLYLLVAVTGIFNLMYVPGKVIVRGNATATAANVLRFQSLYSINILVGLVSSILFLFVALVLYRLLKEVNGDHAAVMVILVLVQFPLGLLELANQLMVLTLVRGADFLGVFSKPQRDALAMLLLQINNKTTSVAEIFWGLWLFPLGWLVFRSRFLPRFLGVWLLVNGLAYVALSCTALLAPGYLDSLNSLLFPALFGELALTLWLFVMGAKPSTDALQSARVT